ncbi:hypothetical protein ACMFMG_003932 [Clarireedia jacksonii]
MILLDTGYYFLDQSHIRNCTQHNSSTHEAPLLPRHIYPEAGGKRHTCVLYLFSSSEYSALICRISDVALIETGALPAPVPAAVLAVAVAGRNFLSTRRRIASWNCASGRRASFGQRESARR